MHPPLPAHTPPCGPGRAWCLGVLLCANQPAREALGPTFSTPACLSPGLLWENSDAPTAVRLSMEWGFHQCSRRSVNQGAMGPFSLVEGSRTLRRFLWEVRKTVSDETGSVLRQNRHDLRIDRSLCRERVPPRPRVHGSSPAPP